MRVHLLLVAIIAVLTVAAWERPAPSACRHPGQKHSDDRDFESRLRPDSGDMGHPQRHRHAEVVPGVVGAVGD